MEVAIKYLNKLGESFGFAEFGTRFSVIIMVFLLAVITHFIIQKILLKVLYNHIDSNKFNWDEHFKKRKVFSRVANIIPALIIYLFSPVFNSFEIYIEKITSTYIYIMIILVFDAALNALNDIYRNYDISKERPIKSYIQVLKIIISSFVTIVIISNLIDKSPAIILSGLGVMSAVLMLIFKDAILGFVAGIQLATNEMLKIGDWIEMPDFGADGDVIDISLTTAKVRNFDNTITSLPTYALVSNSFRNWRGMQEKGARRIKRSILIDVNSIFFLDEEWIDKLKKFDILKEYLEEKSQSNSRLTNIGTLRIYLQNYLKVNEHIRQDMTNMVRQLPPYEKGLPLEIYAFADTIVWTEYEKIQADIFDHIFAIAKDFGIETFQDPSGNDIKNLIKKETI